MENKITINHLSTQKNVAVQCMERFQLAVPYIQDFEQKDQVHLFNGINALLIEPDSVLGNKIKEIERLHKVKIYAVTHDFLECIGETFSFLCVNRYDEDWESMLIGDNSPVFMAYAYVWNVRANHCSEFGTVIIESLTVNLRRLG